MIICLGDELLKYVPVAVSLLLTDCMVRFEQYTFIIILWGQNTLQSQEIQEFIPLINQLIAKYKERISPFLQNVFMPVVQTIVTWLSTPFDPNDMEVGHR